MKQNETLCENDMATKIANAIQCLTTIPVEFLIVTVRDNWVCLHGTLKEKQQKEFVEEVVRNLNCVRGVTNLIAIDPRMMARK